jgi:hypothetical protein
MMYWNQITKGKETILHTFQDPQLLLGTLQTLLQQIPYFQVMEVEMEAMGQASHQIQSIMDKTGMPNYPILHQETLHLQVAEEQVPQILPISLTQFLIPGLKDHRDILGPQVVVVAADLQYHLTLQCQCMGQ